MIDLGNFTLSDLEKYVEFAKTLRNAPMNTAVLEHPLTPEQLESLIKYAERQQCMFPSFDLLAYRHNSYPCGCMGITHEDDYVCGCAMGYNLELYKFEVALEIKRRSHVA